jgi:glycosyltransferase involved in cell wall biosynthesis
MERVAYELYKKISLTSDVVLIKWSRSNKWLLMVLPYFLLKSSWILFTKKIDIIYLQDGLLSPIGLLLKFFRKPVVITVHGLDITYDNVFYQFIVPRCIKRLNKVIVISEATKQECIKRGIPETKLFIVPNGISDVYYTNEDKRILRNQLSSEINIQLQRKKILLSVGRLVERKGFHWFVGEVVPKLLKKRSDFVYLIVGEGKFNEIIERLVYKNDLFNHVFMLGRVNDRTLKLLFNSSDVFVMPNIPVKGDIEGFGIVALEAASCGLPVVASRLEGLKDAIVEGKNGFFVKAYDVNGFVEMVDLLLKKDRDRKKLRDNIRDFTLENYSWKNIAKLYFKGFQKNAKI